MIDASVGDILGRLSDYDYLRAYNMRKRRRLENTTNWILKHPDFLAWLNGEGNPCMWLSGIGNSKCQSFSNSTKY